MSMAQEIVRQMDWGAKVVQELRRQGLEAYMRLDYTTASRIAKLLGDPDPVEHELDDLKQTDQRVDATQLVTSLGEQSIVQEFEKESK